MTKTLFPSFGIWAFGIYLLFGACNLVLLLRNQYFVAILHAILLTTNRFLIKFQRLPED